MFTKSLQLAIAVTSLAVISGCASSARVDRLEQRMGYVEKSQQEHAQQLAYHSQQIALHTRELDRVVGLYQRQIELVGQLQQSLAAVNAGARNAVEQANRHWSALQSLQTELSRMDALQKRFRPTRHGDTWLVVFDDA